ncbi:glycosyltransferase [Streptomyces griseoviridis]|uniref:Glycosyl transferase family 1 n=1 Tax=Streptomyces griseoviridis TaxID=45398 RepID=A0A918L7N3_STRGD|nr:glycosyltransferase [Streptomyces niveoruber]GGS17875.1 glycosyl transferase family 1 [Streptomyces niveoruber]
MHQSPTDRPRPRVLHITQPVDGGVARVLADLTRAQLAAGLDVVVACPEGATAAALRSLGADVRPWGAVRAPGPATVTEVRRLSAVIGAVRPDLVHAHSAKAGLAGRLAVRGRIPTVFQPHAWSFEAVRGVAAGLALGWERRGARWAARVVCVSEGERLRGALAGVRARWAVIPNGVDPDRFSPGPAAPAVRPPLPAGDGEADGPLVVCVGRLCRQKGQDVLLAAWPRVAEKVPGARLVLVGDGPDRERLAAAAPASVRFAGAVEDPVPWYRAAGLVVLPSRWEGMALAPLEAMACGRPVVVTDVDGARECLPPALVPHCLIPPGDPAALADAVSALLLDAPLGASLGRRGRAHVLAAHDVRRTAAAVTELYRTLLTGGAEPRSRAAARTPLDAGPAPRRPAHHAPPGTGPAAAGAPERPPAGDASVTGTPPGTPGTPGTPAVPAPGTPPRTPADDRPITRTPSPTPVGHAPVAGGAGASSGFTEDGRHSERRESVHS